MKLKVYNIAAMACFVLIALGSNSFAQQTGTGTSSSSSTTPATRATAPRAAIRGLSVDSLNNITLATGQTLNLGSDHFAYAPAQSIYSFHNGTLSNLASTNGVYYLDAFGGSQDTTYLKKMKALQEKMQTLQKEMSALRAEDMKTRNVELAKRNAERQLTMQRKYADAFASSDKKFGEKFSLAGTRYGAERNADLDKKVQSGEVKLKTKSYSKSYPVNANDKIAIVNRFGKVTVNAWNKNEIKVDVEIKAYADDDDKASDLLDLVSISDSKNTDGVNFTTKIEEQKNTWFGTMTSNGKTSVRSTVVNYTVYLPTKNAVSISNSYGAVILPDMSGKLTLKNMFGTLSAKSLSNVGNVLNLQYVDADIESLNGGDLDMRFGTLKLQSADKLNADLQYTPAKFGKLTNSAIIKTRFGDGVQINTLDKNLKVLTIDSQYTPVKLASINDANFFVTTSYGDFTYDKDKVSVTSKTPTDDAHNYSMSKTYKGQVGKGDSEKMITIKSSFTSVKFDQ